MIKRDKLDKKAAQGIFVGYNTISKAYKVFQPQIESMVINRYVHFVKNEEWNWEQKIQDSNQLNLPIANVEDQRNEDFGK